MVTVEATSGTVSVRHAFEGVPDTYSQTYIVWTGDVMVAMPPAGSMGIKPGTRSIRSQGYGFRSRYFQFQ